MSSKPQTTLLALVITFRWVVPKQARFSAFTKQPSRIAILANGATGSKWHREKMKHGAFPKDFWVLRKIALLLGLVVGGFSGILMAADAQPSVPVSMLAGAMARHVLSCVEGRTNGDCVAAEVWGLLQLQMPQLASDCLRSGAVRLRLSSLDASCLEGEVARLASSRAREYANLLMAYQSMGSTSNSLWLLHMTNLGGNIQFITAQGGGNVFGRESAGTLRLAQVIVRIPALDVTRACSNASWVELVNQCRLVREIRRQQAMAAVVCIATGRTDGVNLEIRWPGGELRAGGSTLVGVDQNLLTEADYT
jgi:hypothetical protein